MREQRSGWVVGGCCLGAGSWGARESVNSRDIGCPDLAGGGREDGLATTGHLRKREQEEGGREVVMEVWSQKKKQKGVRRISMARQRHVWISLPSLQSLTLQQRRSGSNREGEKKCLLILPREINTYA